MLIQFSRSHRHEADHCGKFLLDNLFKATDSTLGGLTYRQRAEHLSHPSTIQPAPHGSRQTQNRHVTVSPSPPILRIEPETDIFPGRFDGGCVAAIAAVILRFARALGCAMASEHVPDPSKNRQPLDSGFEFATEGMCLLCFTLLHNS
jgi:hypothetical protein